MTSKWITACLKVQVEVRKRALAEMLSVLYAVVLDCA